MHYSNAVHPDLRTFRDAMRSEVHIIVRDFRWNTDVTQQLRDPLQDQRLAVLIAKFLHSMLQVFYSPPMFIPAPYIYSPLLLTQA